ncbi:uncharacterized protein LOC124175050 [Neodiprion fabricii]|uniref:uncharacterized protein LOC124175050 n=1 Tax=Neodiprion fabricii TaxID=2872261 RepID=UPI001ED8F999|nr:uncharacterized protein LOC124175050 [Neodiprion fabricii]
MAATGSSKGSVLEKFGLQPVTKCSLAKFYVPALGAISYTGLSINVMNPRLIVRIFPTTDITNLLLGSTFLGTGSYIYTREHLKNAPPANKIAYSAAGAVLLSFGSVLVWSILRSIIPPNSSLHTIAGIGSGIAFIKIGTSYLEFVDSQVVAKK